MLYFADKRGLCVKIQSPDQLIMYFVVGNIPRENLTFTGFICGEASRQVTQWLQSDYTGPDRLEVNHIPTVYYPTLSLRDMSLGRWTYSKIYFTITRQPGAERNVIMNVDEVPIMQVVSFLPNGTPVLMPNNDPTVVPIRGDITMMHSIDASLIRLQNDEPQAGPTTAATIDANQPAPSP